METRPANEPITERSKLKSEILARRKELEATLARAKADAMEVADEKVDKARKRLDELKTLTKDGFEQMSESTARKLNEWLHRR